MFVVEGEEAPIVEDQEVCFGEGGEEPAITAIPLGDVEFWEETWQTDILCGVAFTAGLLSEGAGEVGFAAAGGAGDDEVMVLRDKGASGELCHEGFIETSWMAVIDVLDTGLLFEPGFLESAVEATVFPFCDLSADHETQSLLEGEVADLGHIHLLFESAGHSGKAKGLELVECGMNQHHGSPYS